MNPKEHDLHHVVSLSFHSVFKRASHVCAISFPTIPRTFVPCIFAAFPLEGPV